MAIRSGRFKVADASAGIKIVEGRSGAYYRILNSGDSSFNVNAGGAVTALAPTFSLDVVVGSNIIITGAASTPIEGIYDYLDAVNTEDISRSGRFNIKTNAATKLKIIDLRIGGPKKKAYYRIFNSGINQIQVWESAAASAFATVLAGQSFDFEVSDSGAKQDIYVNSTADNLPISGIYEFLGIAE